MLSLGLVLLAGGFGLLSWCSVKLGAINPGRRLPGRLPDVRHPPGYMPLGALGLALVAVGAATIRDSADVYAWLIAAAAGTVALAVPFALHNHRLAH